MSISDQHVDTESRKAETMDVPILLGCVNCFCPATCAAESLP